jgi:hypothetical protein
MHVLRHFQAIDNKHQSGRTDGWIAPLLVVFGHGGGSPPGSAHASPYRFSSPDGMI